MEKSIDPATGFTTVSVKIQPVGKITLKYSRKVCIFDGELEGVVRRFTIWFPITDRRLARRIARKEGKRFVKRGRHYEFK